MSNMADKDFCNPLNFIVGKNEMYDLEEGEKKCYLLANGLGGFSSLTAAGSCSRHDHGLFIGVKKAPNYRIHVVTNVEEKVVFENNSLEDKEESVSLFSQRFATRTSNVFGGKYLQSFEFKYIPKWSYKVNGLEIIKEIVTVYNKNTVALRYKVYSDELDKKCRLVVNPLFRLTNKDDYPSESNEFNINCKYAENITTGNRCYYKSNGLISIDGGKYDGYSENIFYPDNKVKKSDNICLHNPQFYNDLFFEYDSRDGRPCIGSSFKGCSFIFDIDKKYQEFYIVFSCDQINVSKDCFYASGSDNFVNSLFSEEIKRQENLLEIAGIKDSGAQSLVLASDKFITYRKSTNGKTIMAGYPFFGDWGRDTMISLLGCVFATGRFEDGKSILRTFKSYEKKGMMPNVFPEGENDSPMYNTVDASLLFINSVYEYFVLTGDINFVEEMYDTMEDIISNYRNGTDFHIKMDIDGLISAGDNLEQLTWMDVRFGDILPTPRQGKPVEVNAYWYNDLRIMDIFAEKLGKDKKDYLKLAEELVKPNFLKLFWNEKKGCLKDVISKNKEWSYSDNQIRPNQVWALSMPFSMIDKDKAVKILNVIYSELYTPFGLRSLSPLDKNFHKTYGGSHFNRDMAYHQGTVWGYPLGAYYIAVMRFCDDGYETVARQLKYTETALNEGCLGQIAEIYDGENPYESQGCFAQAWSVGEILRVYKELENNLR